MLVRRGERSYCYRSQRQGAQVRRVYVGSGEAALEAQEAIGGPRRLKEERGRALVAEQQHDEATAPLARLSGLIDALVWAALESRGFRLHARGQWRLARR